MMLTGAVGTLRATKCVIYINTYGFTVVDVLGNVTCWRGVKVPADPF